jgi:hypothetical protein
MPQKGLCRSDVEPVEQRGEVGGNSVLAQCRGAANVGEQNRDVHLGATRGKRITTTTAQIGVLA